MRTYGSLTEVAWQVNEEGYMFFNNSGGRLSIYVCIYHPIIIYSQHLFTHSSSHTSSFLKRFEVSKIRERGEKMERIRSSGFYIQIIIVPVGRVQG